MRCEFSLFSKNYVLHPFQRKHGTSQIRFLRHKVRTAEIFHSRKMTFYEKAPSNLPFYQFFSHSQKCWEAKPKAITSPSYWKRSQKAEVGKFHSPTFNSDLSSVICQVSTDVRIAQLWTEFLLPYPCNPKLWVSHKAWKYTLILSSVCRTSNQESHCSASLSLQLPKPVLKMFNDPHPAKPLRKWMALLKHAVINTWWRRGAVKAICRWMAPVSDKTSLKKTLKNNKTNNFWIIYINLPQLSLPQKKWVVSSIVPGLSARWRGNVVKAPRSSSCHWAGTWLTAGNCNPHRFSWLASLLFWLFLAVSSIQSTQNQLLSLNSAEDANLRFSSS